MKKVIYLLLLVMIVGIVGGCTSNGDLQDQIDDLEKRITALDGGVVSADLDEDDLEDIMEEDEDDEEVEEDIEEDEDDEDEVSSVANEIRITSPSNDTTIYEEPIEFKGIVSANTNKVVVTARGMIDDDDGSYEYNDVYTLQSFKYGDGKFSYKAQSNFNNLAFGTNEYEFEAYFDDGTTESQKVTIFYLEK